MTFELLTARAAELGVQLGAAQLGQLERYRQLLLEWNQRINLTAIREPAEVERRHFVDSLSCVLALRERWPGGQSLSLIDVGSGGGFPGVVLKLAWPSISLTLLDSVRKKTRFLEELVAELNLKDVEVITARAEDLGRDPVHRERYDVAVSRALAPLPVLLELCLPLVRVGGRLVAPRRGDLVADAEGSRAVAALLGGVPASPIMVDDGVSEPGSGLTIVDKIGPTPREYPRRAGVPSRRPLLRSRRAGQLV